MAKKKVAKAANNEGGEEQKAQTPVINEDRQIATNLKSLNDLLVRQTMELRQQVAGLEKLKEKLVNDISQAEERAQVLVVERNSCIRKQRDSEEEGRISSAVVDVERMLNAAIIRSQISQHNQETEIWEKGLESYLLEARQKQEAVEEAWRIEKEGLENTISEKEAKISEMIELTQALEKSWKLEKAGLERTISSKETTISKVVELKEAIEESWKTEQDELRRTMTDLETETRRMFGLVEESKKSIGERDRQIAQLLNDVARLNVTVSELDESCGDLVSTNSRMCEELQQSKDGFLRVSNDNKELNKMVSKFKSEMEEKDARLKSLKEEMDEIEFRAAEWMKGFKGASDLGEKVLCMLRRTAEMLTTFDSGELIPVAGREESGGDDEEGLRKYEEELEAICVAFKKEVAKVEEMVQRIDSMKAELVESENKRRSMNMWHALFSTITGAGAILTLAFFAKLR